MQEDLPSEENAWPPLEIRLRAEPVLYMPNLFQEVQTRVHTVETYATHPFHQHPEIATAAA